MKNTYIEKIDQYIKEFIEIKPKFTLFAGFNNFELTTKLCIMEYHIHYEYRLVEYYHKMLVQQIQSKLMDLISIKYPEIFHTLDRIIVEYFDDNKEIYNQLYTRAIVNHGTAEFTYEDALKLTEYVPREIVSGVISTIDDFLKNDIDFKIDIVHALDCMCLSKVINSNHILLEGCDTLESLGNIPPTDNYVFIMNP